MLAHQVKFVFRRRGEMLINIFRVTLWLIAVCVPMTGMAISVGTLTFSMPADNTFVAKRVLNNNPSARLYQISIVEIDRPGENETRARPTDGELLFAPRQLLLQPGEGDYFKFYYHGPQDNRERYYRVSFREIPTHSRTENRGARSSISADPIIIMETILVVRPREVHFEWHYDPLKGSVSNTGNTWFKLIVKPGCRSTEDEGETWYLRPGDTVQQKTLQKIGRKYLIYNEKFIGISDDCA